MYCYPHTNPSCTLTPFCLLRSAACVRTVATLEPLGARTSLLDLFGSHALRRAIAEALPGGSAGHATHRPVALYTDAEADTAEGGGGAALVVRLCFSDVSFIHALRDGVLSGDFEASLSLALSRVPRGQRTLLEGPAQLTSDGMSDASGATSVPVPPAMPAGRLVSGFFSRTTSQRSVRRKPSVLPASLLCVRSDGIEWYDGDGADPTPRGRLAIDATTTCELRPDSQALDIGTCGESLTILAPIASTLVGSAAAAPPAAAPSLESWHMAIASLIAESRAASAAATATAVSTSAVPPVMSTLGTGSGGVVPAMGSGAVGVSGMSPSSAALAGAVRVEADKRAFAEVYEASLLVLEQLTPHQRSVLGEARDAEHVLLEAPAGAGKTFVAMARMLEVLLHDVDDSQTPQPEPESALSGPKDGLFSSGGAKRERGGERGAGGTSSFHGSSGSVLFACSSPPLCYFVTRWVCKRVADAPTRERVLSRLYLLYSPMDEGPRAVSLDPAASRIITTRVTSPPLFDLVVVDEAHHVYSQVRTAYPTPRTAHPRPAPRTPQCALRAVPLLVLREPLPVRPEARRRTLIAF